MRLTRHRSQFNLEMTSNELLKLKEDITNLYNQEKNREEEARLKKILQSLASYQQEGHDYNVHII